MSVGAPQGPAGQTAGGEDVFLYVEGGDRPMNKTDLGLSPGAVVAASRVVVSGDVHMLRGWAIVETTGANPASIRLRDGTGINNEIFARINLAAGESTRDIMSSKGVKCTTGNIWLEVLSGSVEGVLFWT